MLKYIKLKYALSIALLAGAAMFSACDDDEEGNSQVVLNSFGPSGVHHGEKIKFVGLNMDKVTAIVLQPGVEIPQSAFATQSSSLIELIIPVTAEEGKIV